MLFDQPAYKGRGAEAEGLDRSPGNGDFRDRIGSNGIEFEPCRRLKLRKSFIEIHVRECFVTAIEGELDLLGDTKLDHIDGAELAELDLQPDPAAESLIRPPVVRVNVSGLDEQAGIVRWDMP